MTPEQTATRLEAALRYIYLKAIPTTVTPEEFVKGDGNWGLTESEYRIAKRAADALVAVAASTPPTEPGVSAPPAAAEVPHIIVIGNPVDGIEFYGPLPSAAAAAEHANHDGDLPDHDWWIAPLHPLED